MFFKLFVDVLDVFYSSVGFVVGNSEVSSFFFKELLPFGLMIFVFYLLVRAVFKLFGIKKGGVK